MSNYSAPQNLSTYLQAGNNLSDVASAATAAANLSATPILKRARVTGQIAAGSVTLPIGAVIRDVVVTNTTANAVTGGLKFGTTAGAVDVVAALAVDANGLAFVTDALLLKRYFSSSATQQIFFGAVVAWNSASVTVDIYYYV